VKVLGWGELPGVVNLADWRRSSNENRYRHLHQQPPGNRGSWKGAKPSRFIERPRIMEVRLRDVLFHETMTKGRRNRSIVSFLLAF
jgi:hypothetical protein